MEGFQANARVGTNPHIMLGQCKTGIIPLSKAQLQRNYTSMFNILTAYITVNQYMNVQDISTGKNKKRKKKNACKLQYNLRVFLIRRFRSMFIAFKN